MNQTDSKRVLAICVGVLSILCVKTCPENHFQLPDSQCCHNCPEGMYVSQNCSERPGVFIGVGCNKCRRCEETGQITVSNCTQFTDTQCAMDHSVPTPETQFDRQSTQILRTDTEITLYGCSSVVAAVFMLAVIMAVCFIRINKSGESDESSAGEPFHIKDAEIV